MKHPRAALYVRLLNMANGARDQALRTFSHDAQVLALEMNGDEFADAHEELNRMKAEDPPGWQGGWDGRFRKAGR